MRSELLERLPEARYHRFLVFVMGPYKTFDLADVVDEDAAVDPEDLAVDFGSWDDAAGEYTERDVRDLLEHVRDGLREDPGFNAFLATDAGIDLEDVDAATQSIEFARAANVVAFVAPRVGKNLGVGIETGAVLEALDGDERERIVFVHEEDVRSALIGALSRRWEATVYRYGDRAELLDRIRTFAANVMHREQFGDLPELDASVGDGSGRDVSVGDGSGRDASDGEASESDGTTPPSEHGG